MRRTFGPRGPMPGRVLGLYALAAMERDGPLYGYLLSERIADRTQGAWRPGAGAIYPALGSITSRGLARVAREGRRQVYTITPRGRRFLADIRRTWGGASRQGPDLGRLWMEIAGSGDWGQHTLQHLRRHLDTMTAGLESDPDARAGQGLLREQVLAELEVARSRLIALRAPTGTERKRPRRSRS